MQGTGTFRALEGSQPFVGSLGEVHQEPETRIEVIFPAPLERQLCTALVDAHPYEEPAYDIYPVEQAYTKAGAGVIGKLAEPLSPQDFLAYLKKKLNVTCIRYTKTPAEKSTDHCGLRRRRKLPDRESHCRTCGCAGYR